MAEKKEGFIKLNRGFFENPFWKEKRVYSNAEAWIDLIQSARFETTPEKVFTKMKFIFINRGEIRASQRYLAQRWGWSVGKVNRFINVLEMERMVERRMEHSETIVKLCNYGLYNTEEKKKMNTNRHAGGELNGTPTEHRQIQTKEGKEREEGKELKINNMAVAKATDCTIDFEKLLSLINLKTGRSFKIINKDVKAKYKARMKDGYSKHDINNAIINASKDEYHLNSGCKYLTPEFFSRAITIDKYSNTGNKAITTPQPQRRKL